MIIVFNAVSILVSALMIYAAFLYMKYCSEIIEKNTDRRPTLKYMIYGNLSMYIGRRMVTELPYGNQVTRGKLVILR